MSELLKNQNKFDFSEICVQSFNKLKTLLVQAPVLAIYSPHLPTELHTDASSRGFGAVVLQRQIDGKWHPIAYFSKKTSDAEQKYHSFELETLAIIYSLRRFETWLKGIKIKIVTDCSTLTMTLAKRNINPRIARWALELEEYDYDIIHRKGTQMGHVDALSRNIALITAEEIDFNLQATQVRDEKITQLKEKLENSSVDPYCLVNGLVYKKTKEDNLLFYVPNEMEYNIIQTTHDKIGHLGINKTYDQVRSIYWFPAMKEKNQKCIDNCLRCIMHTVPPRVRQNVFPIPKKPVPFDTLHIDHYGPLPTIKSKKRHILGICDAFTKYVKLYAVSTTSTREVIAVLKKYFADYNRPRRIVMDRATCFTSKDFVDFLKDNNVEQILNATASPQANGQIERVNRVLTPMIGISRNEKTIRLGSNIASSRICSEQYSLINYSYCP